MKKILLLCTFALLVSCGTKKHLPKVDGKDNIEITTDAEKKSYESVLAKSFDFETLSAKAKYSFNGASLTGKFFVDHGKRLTMTMTVLGIEVVRVETDKEKVTLVNKLDKIYTTLPIEELADKFGMKDEMQYEALEALLLGRMYIPGIGEAKENDFNHFAFGFDIVGSLIAHIKKEKYQLTYYSTPVLDKRLEMTEVITNGGNGEKNFYVNYKDYIKLGDGEIPTSSTVSIGLLEEKILATLSISNPILNGKSIARFEPTAAYNKVELKDFIEAVKNLKK